jgi:hypothetical protein
VVVREEGGITKDTSGKFSKKLVNKNVIKHKIGDPPSNFVRKALTPRPPQGFWQKYDLPPHLGFLTGMQL